VDVSELGWEGGDVLAIDHEAKVVAVGLTPLGGLTTITQNSETLSSGRGTSRRVGRGPSALPR